MTGPQTDLLTTMIARLDLPGLEAKALEIVARDPIGMIESDAGSQVASQTNRSRADCDRALLGLAGRGLLLRIDSDQPRLIAAYDALGIPADQRQLIVAKSQVYQMLGHPHSPAAMQTLKRTFEESIETIYIGMEITEIGVFSALESRSDAGRQTFFLMPPKSQVNPQRREHYDEIVDGWVKFLKKGRSHLRDNVRLCISKEVTQDIYTSALTRHHARIDVYAFGADSTRTGQILQAPSQSSLYSLVYAKYRLAWATAVPIFWIWPLEWFQFYVKRLWALALGLFLLAIAALLQRTHHHGFADSIIACAAVNFLTQFWLTTRAPKELYQ